jgi:hypothetical protein
MVMPGDERTEQHRTEQDGAERNKTLRNHETNALSNLTPFSCSTT